LAEEGRLEILAKLSSMPGGNHWSTEGAAES
jgi:hypothetical protein